MITDVIIGLLISATIFVFIFGAFELYDWWCRGWWEDWFR